MEMAGTCVLHATQLDTQSCPTLDNSGQAEARKTEGDRVEGHQKWFGERGANALHIPEQMRVGAGG